MQLKALQAARQSDGLWPRFVDRGFSTFRRPTQTRRIGTTDEPPVDWPRRAGDFRSSPDIARWRKARRPIAPTQDKFIEEQREYFSPVSADRRRDVGQTEITAGAVQSTGASSVVPIRRVCVVGGTC